MMLQAVHRHRVGAERLGCRLEPSIEGGIFGLLDELAVEQIADNLLSNAVKYGAGEPIEVSLVSDGTKARLTVRDHGIGISEEDQARIFDAFERAVTRREEGGFGIGLWLIRHLVDAMHGENSCSQLPHRRSDLHFDPSAFAPVKDLMANDPIGADGQTPLERVPTGIPGVDTVLRGGFLNAGIYIVRGKPGAGKTIFGNQFCFNHVAAGHRAVCVTLLAETHDRTMQHMRSMSFFEPALIPDGLYYVNGFRILEEDGIKGLSIYCGATFGRIMRPCSSWMDSSSPRRRAGRTVISGSSSTSFRPT